MTNSPHLSITIRRTQWFSSTIVGYARVLIDNRILLNELPVFGHEENMAVIITPAQVVACPLDMDLGMLNRMVYSFREIIEQAVIRAMAEQLKKAGGVGP